MNNEINDSKQYPEPNFSAQDAWKNMQDLLDKEMPVESKKRKRLILFWMIPLLFTGIGLYFLSNLNIKDNIISINKKSTVKNNETGKNTINNKLEANKIEITSIINTKIAPNAINSSIKFTSSNNNNTLKINTIHKNTPKFSAAKETNEDYTISTPEVNVLKQIANVYYGRTNQNHKIGIINNQSTTNFTEITLQNDEETKGIAMEASKPVVEKKNMILENAIVKVPKNKLKNSLHYGLQWNILLPQTNSYLDYRAKNQPLSVAIPEFWVSKDLSTKSEIALQLNPYSQYTVRSNNTLATDDYPVTIYQGSNPTPTIIHYTRTKSLLKVMGLELTAKYTYHFNNKFSVAVGIGNNWLNAAVENDKIISKTHKLSQDSTYGIAKGFNDWNYIKSSFVVGRIEMLYQFKKMEIGVAFLKPLSNIYSISKTSTIPVNGRLVVRWEIK